MGEITNGVSWLAVIVGAVLSFLLGWQWYSPKLFGEKWAAGSGVKMGSGDQMPAGAMASQAIGLLLERVIRQCRPGSVFVLPVNRDARAIIGMAPAYCCGNIEIGGDVPPVLRAGFAIAIDRHRR